MPTYRLPPGRTNHQLEKIVQNSIARAHDRRVTPERIRLAPRERVWRGIKSRRRLYFFIVSFFIISAQAVSFFIMTSSFAMVSFLAIAM